MSVLGTHESLRGRVSGSSHRSARRLFGARGLRDADRRAASPACPLRLRRSGHPRARSRRPAAPTPTPRRSGRGTPAAGAGRRAPAPAPAPVLPAGPRAGAAPAGAAAMAPEPERAGAGPGRGSPAAPAGTRLLRCRGAAGAGAGCAGRAEPAPAVELSRSRRWRGRARSPSAGQPAPWSSCRRSRPSRPRLSRPSRLRRVALEPVAAVEPEPSSLADRGASSIHSVPSRSTSHRRCRARCDLETSRATPAPELEELFAPKPQRTDFHVVVRLRDGDGVEVGSFRDFGTAMEGAQEVIEQFSTATEGRWPFYAGPLHPPRPDRLGRRGRGRGETLASSRPT